MCNECLINYYTDQEKLLTATDDESATVIDIIPPTQQAERVERIRKILPKRIQKKLFPVDNVHRGVTANLVTSKTAAVTKTTVKCKH
jgi:hypothetical protein